jgi:hypothetical protein
MNKKMTQNDIKKARRALLDETISHFNLNNRGITKDGCSYAAGCAVGRKINSRLAKKLDKVIDITGDSSVSCPEVFNQLPKKLQVLGVDFLSELQQLHDGAEYWNFTGLSFSGETKVERIVSVYC